MDNNNIEYYDRSVYLGIHTDTVLVNLITQLEHMVASDNKTTGLIKQTTKNLIELRRVLNAGWRKK